MPVKQFVKRKKRIVTIGDLDSYITLQSRGIKAPSNDDNKFNEVFTGTASVWALVKTVSGSTLFDSTGTEVDVTHHIYIRFLAGVTSETWVLLENGERLDIIAVEDLDNKNEFMFIPCTNKGLNTKVASGL